MIDYSSYPEKHIYKTVEINKDGSSNEGQCFEFKTNLSGDQMFFSDTLDQMLHIVINVDKNELSVAKLYSLAEDGQPVLLKSFQDMIWSC
jgi:hypothetical protein